MEFVASLVGGVVWPVAIVILMIVFRRPITSLISDVSEGEAGPGGVKFKRTWERQTQAVVRSEAASPDGSEPPGTKPPNIPGDPADEIGPEPPPIERFHAVTQPELSIHGAHRQVAARLHGLLGDEPAASLRLSNDIAALGARAARSGLISVEVLDSLQGLAVLHDLAREAPERVTPAHAQQFQVLAKAVMYTLSDRRLRHDPPSAPNPAAMPSGSDDQP